MFVTLALSNLAGPPPASAEIGHLQGEMSGEVTTHSVVLQSRLTATKVDSDGEVPGAAGIARFEIADNSDFKNAVHTVWMNAVAATDYVIKTEFAETDKTSGTPVRAKSARCRCQAVGSLLE